MNMQDIRLSICVPMNGMCQGAFAVSLARLMQTLAHQKVEAQLRTVTSSCLPSNRENLVRQVLEDGTSTHLLFLDDDMRFEAWSVLCLMRRQLPVVAVNYRMKIPSQKVYVAADLLNNRVSSMGKKGVEEVAYTGFGVSLFEVDAIRKTNVPRFLTPYQPAIMRYMTEDVTFFKALREQGYPCWLDHDASRGVAHRGTYDYQLDD